MLIWLLVIFTVVLAEGVPTCAAQQAATEAGTLPAPIYGRSGLALSNDRQ